MHLTSFDDEGIAHITYRSFVKVTLLSLIAHSSGVTVVVIGSTVGEGMLGFMERAGIMIVKVVLVSLLIVR